MKLTFQFLNSNVLNFKAGILYLILPAAMIVLSLSCSGKNSAIAVSAEGGTFNFKNGIILEVPANAVAEPTTLFLEPLKTADVETALSTSDLATGVIYGGFRGTPAGTVFKKPVKVTLPLETVPKPDIAFYHAYTDPDTGMLLLTDTNVIINPQNNTAILETLNFSDHYLVEVGDTTFFSSFDPEVDWNNCQNWNGKNADGTPKGTMTAEDDCRCGRRRYESSFVDFSNSEGCQYLRSVLKVIYIDCEEPTFWTMFTTEESGCSTQKKVLAEAGGHSGSCLEYGRDWYLIGCNPYPYNWYDGPCNKSLQNLQAIVICQKTVYESKCSPPQVLDKGVVELRHTYYYDTHYDYSNACTGEGEKMVFFEEKEE